MKLYRINLTQKEITTEEITDTHPLYKYAGRALSSKIIADEVPPETVPLGKNNKLIFATGFLGGTTAPNSGRLSIGCKSPLTKGIKESNVGGRAPAFLSRMSIRGLIIEGKAPDWVYLHIKDGEIKIIDATPFLGLNNYELTTSMLESGQYSAKSGLFSIGTAGEYGLKAASIASTDMEGYPSRHAGRGGVGAVMGSKNLKFIIVESPSTSKIDYLELSNFRTLTKKWNQELFKAKRVFSKFGTAIGIQGMNSEHGLPTQNFRRGSFKHADQISGQALNDYIIKNKGKYGLPCSPGCAIQCSNLVRHPDGHHLTSSLEYETIALTGSNLNIGTIEKLAEIDHACDDIGVDTIEIGGALGVFMETGKIAWGDAEAVISLINGITAKNPESLIIGNGATAVGEFFHIERVPQVKGQSIPGYDPRTFKGMGITYLTSPMGADHTAGACIKGRKAYGDRDYGDLYTPEVKVELSRDLQIFTMLLDAMGLCYFIGPSWDTTQKLAELLKYRYGWNISPEELRRLGITYLQQEKEYNKKCGLPEVSSLPNFMLRENLEEIERTWDVPQSELDEYWVKLSK